MNPLKSPLLWTLPNVSRSFAVAGCLSWLLVTGSARGAEPARRPNVVFFMVDDMGWIDSGAYGSRYYETPNIDALATQGMLFTEAYAHPVCSPTRCSIMTGKHPARHGLTSAAGHQPPEPKDAPRYAAEAPPNRKVIAPNSLRYMPIEEFTLADALRAAGYRTGHFGKWHLGLTEEYWPRKRGFDVAFHGAPDPGPPGPHGYFSPYSFAAGSITPGPQGEYIVDRVTEEAIRFIRENRGGPFFANVWQYGVHGPWGHKEEYTKRFLDKVDPRGQQRNPVMASMLKSIDESVGRIVATLDELGLKEQTVFIFYSDNGGNVHSFVDEGDRGVQLDPRNRQYQSLSKYVEYAGQQAPTNNYPLRSGKGTLYEGGVRVPLIISWPSTIPGNTRTSALASMVDFYPTLLDLLRIPNEKGLEFDGMSLAEVLKSPDAEPPRRSVFGFQPNGGPSKPGGVTIRQGNWKLIRWFETSRLYPEEFELYDLEADIGESNNLAGTNPSQVAALNAEIDRFLSETNALLPIPNPSYDPTRRVPEEQGRRGNIDRPRRNQPGEESPRTRPRREGAPGNGTSPRPQRQPER